MIVNTDECWLYAGPVNDKDYGRLWFNNKYEMAHRITWQNYHNRVIPEGLHIDHLCRVHRCVNPEHLEAVTPRENNLRGITSAAFYSRRDACKYGHKFTTENTRMQGNTRRCRTCMREYMREYLPGYRKNKRRFITSAV